MTTMTSLRIAMTMEPSVTLYSAARFFGEGSRVFYQDFDLRMSKNYNVTPT